MAKYTPRKSEPSTTNKNFIHTSSGGYNRCIIISGSSCLPNCVGYAWGRWREILGKSHNLSLNNAENWWGNTGDGYKRGSTPKVGAVICWRKGQAGVSSDGAGHVAIVEEVKSNGDIVVSESHYGGVRWRMYTYTKSSGYYLSSSHTFQGFIYLPVEFDNDKNVITPTTSTTTTKTYTKGDYVVNTDLLNVRSGPSTSYARKTYSQFTTNAQAQVLEKAGYKANGYVKGVEFTALEVKDNWGRTPSGWVCLDYCKKI